MALLAGQIACAVSGLIVGGAAFAAGRALENRCRKDPLVGPATHRIVGLVKDYQSRVERMHAKAKKEIENA